MRIVVTRPRRAGEKTATLLQGLGHTPVLLPLSTPHHDTATAASGLAQKPAAFAVTSAEAIYVLALLGDILLPFLDLPLFAVGDATAVAARDAGFKTVLVAAGDGEKLATLIDENRNIFAENNAHLAYFAGVPRTQTLEAALSRLGIPFKTSECYRMTPVDWPHGELDALLLTVPPDVVLFYSGEAVRLFFEAVDVEKYGDVLRRTCFICISEKVASLVPLPLRANAKASTTANETEMLSLLDDLAGT